MKLFLDANVLLDVLLARQPFVNDSERVLSLCAKKVFDGCCSGLTICNLMYILRKHCPMDVARRCMRDFSTYVEIVDVKSTAVASALQSPNPDFEDVVQACCAGECGVDAIVTRDKKGFIDSGILVYTPTELLEKHAGI